MSPATNSTNHSQIGATPGVDPTIDSADHTATGTAASDVSGAPAPGQEHTPSQRAVILAEADIRRTLDRIAHQILESVGSEDSAPVLLVGIPRRGVPLARRLADRMTRFAGGTYPVGALDITLYRDDLRGRPPRALAETDLPTAGVDGLTVVLVDDVLYSGRTIRAAMDALREHGRPAAIRLAVLVDRGHRQLPIRADYVGKNIPTAFDDDVAVHLTETDGIDAVTVERAL